MEILFATKNEHKMQEIKAILKDTPFRVRSMKEADIDLDIVEDGDTFEANALIKALALANATGKIALADDSGLEIDFLNGEPGIYSARYLGEDTPQTVKNAAILERMKSVPENERAARFVAVIAAAIPSPEGHLVTATERATLEGIIAYE
ncbi:MAG: non-canonical purine NTP pyrophosphatase, partial [Clostridiales bacterium]|nr:non-canonical purine NTP pyrophosphatase [Clostridiales bacterium]